MMVIEGAAGMQLMTRKTMDKAMERAKMKNLETQKETWGEEENDGWFYYLKKSGDGYLKQGVWLECGLGVWKLVEAAAPVNGHLPNGGTGM